MEQRENETPSLFTAGFTQLFVAVLLFFALVNGQRDLVVLTIVILAVVGGARLWSWQSLSSLHCRLSINRNHVFPGERVTLDLGVENAKLLPIWLDVALPVGKMLGRSPGDTWLRKSTSLLWFQKTAFRWEMLAERRGVYEVGPLQITTGDMFSFFSRTQIGIQSFSVVIYPRLVSLRPMYLTRRDSYGAPKAVSPIQDPIYILGTRDYEPALPAKYIHWKTSARHDRLQGKVFEPTVQEKVLLAIDVVSFTQRGAEEEFERTLEVAASLAALLDRQGHAVGLIANGSIHGGGVARIPVARNVEQIPAILQVLARLEFKAQGQVTDLFRDGRVLPWGSSCALFAHSVDESVRRAHESLAARRVPAHLFVTAPIRPEEKTNFWSKVYLLDDICVRRAAQE